MRWPGPSELLVWHPCWTIGSAHGAGPRSGTKVHKEDRKVEEDESMAEWSKMLGSFMLTFKDIFQEAGTYRRGGQAQDGAILDVIAVLWIYQNKSFH